MNIDKEIAEEEKKLAEKLYYGEITRKEYNKAMKKLDAFYYGARDDDYEYGYRDYE